MDPLQDTFSLSFVGNLNFSNAINGVQKIIEGLASCESNLESLGGMYRVTIQVVSNLR